MIDCMKYVNKPIEIITTTAYREMAKKIAMGMGEKYIMILKKVLWHIFLQGQIKFLQ